VAAIEVTGGGEAWEMVGARALFDGARTAAGAGAVVGWG
jgi:hypothetical protein